MTGLTAHAELVKKLQHLVSLNDPRRGGPYGGYAAGEFVDSAGKAAAAITHLSAEVGRALDERDTWKDLAHDNAVAADKSARQRDEALKALREIEEIEPATQEMTLAHEMSAIARDTLSRLTEGSDKL